MSHGVVVAADERGLAPLVPPVAYPGRLPTRKRTPLLFDGSESTLVVSTAGHVLRSVSLDDHGGVDLASLDRQQEVMGLDGALTAAATAEFDGVGFLARADRTVWVFDRGEPLFLKRTTHWKAVALASFARRLTETAELPSDLVGDRLARAAVRASIQGHGALFAVAPDPIALEDLVATKDRHVPDHSAIGSVDDDLHRVVARDGPVTTRTLARLSRLDGATVIDPTGALLAYGAIVRSSGSVGEGARTAAARTLSRRLPLAISVSQDGPIVVFHEGERAFSVL